MREGGGGAPGLLGHPSAPTPEMWVLPHKCGSPIAPQNLPRGRGTQAQAPPLRCHSPASHASSPSLIYIPSAHPRSSFAYPPPHHVLPAGGEREGQATPRGKRRPMGERRGVAKRRGRWRRGGNGSVSGGAAEGADRGGNRGKGGGRRLPVSGSRSRSRFPVSVPGRDSRFPVPSRFPSRSAILGFSPIPDPRSPRRRQPRAIRGFNGVAE